MSRRLLRPGIALLVFTLVVGSDAAMRKHQKSEPEKLFPSAPPAAHASSPQTSPLVINVEKLAGGGDESRVEPESLSPYEIARVVKRSSQLMAERRAVLTVDLASTWKRLDIEPSYFETCEGNCEATIFTHELDGDAGEEILLKLIKTDNVCRYVLFRGSPTAELEPKLIGHVDHDFNRYQMSTHRVVNAAGKNWLVIRGQGGSGSGFSRYSETWYEVRRKSLRSVLHYPESGRASSWPRGSSREFQAEVVASPQTEERDEKPVLTIRYSVSYSMNESGEKENALLFENEHHARYVWNERKREFVFAAQLSDVAEDEIFAIAGYEDPELEISSYDVFFKYNLKSLLKIARGQDGERKNWLRQSLEDCARTPATEALLKALQH